MILELKIVMMIVDLEMTAMMIEVLMMKIKSSEHETNILFLGSIIL